MPLSFAHHRGAERYLEGAPRKPEPEVEVERGRHSMCVVAGKLASVHDPAHESGSALVNRLYSLKLLHRSGGPPWNHFDHLELRGRLVNQGGAHLHHCWSREVPSFAALP